MLSFHPNLFKATRGRPNRLKLIWWIKPNVLRRAGREKERRRERGREGECRSRAFIGGFISAHYAELYIKPRWKPRGSLTVKRCFQMRKTPTSNGSSSSLSLSRSLSPSLSLSSSPALPLSSLLSQDLSPFFFLSFFILRLGHSVLFLEEADQQRTW